MSSPPEYGCEVYEGNADVIGAAVSASDWPSLRGGIAAHSFVGFPQFIAGDYFDWFAAAVASVLEQPEVRITDSRMVAGEDGNWGAYVLPHDWVAAVASVPASHIPWLGQLWRKEYLRQAYAEQDDWPEVELLDSLYRLTVLCEQAISRGTDVVLLAQ